MRIGSLFAGIGGFDLAARWMGWETAWYSEIEPYACRVMEKNFPGVPNLGDITKITAPPPVDVLCGGFPCQDISSAGRGAGIEGGRSGLWKHYARLIGEVLPEWCVIENSPRLRRLGLGTVLHDLSALGYDATWDCIPAAAIGAPHERDRIWIVAHSNAVRERRSRYDGRWAEKFAAHLRSSLADSARVRLEGGCESATVCSSPSAERSGELTRGGGGQHRGWSVEPNVGRVAHGVPARVDRIRGLGNAVVPQVPYLLFQAIAAVSSGATA